MLLLPLVALRHNSVVVSSGHKGDDVIRNSFCDHHGDHKKKASCSVDTNGNDTVTDLEFSKIMIEKREDYVRESDGELSSTNGIRSESSRKDVVGDDKATSSNIDNDHLQMIGPHSQLPKPEAPRGVTSSPPESENCPPIN
ncbi:hypothetical protein U1Q18_048538 [Sarracenia purpurea var. burkii]